MDQLDFKNMKRGHVLPMNRQGNEHFQVKFQKSLGVSASERLEIFAGCICETSLQSPGD